MSNVKKIIAIQIFALCTMMLLGGTVHASEVTGTLNSSADPNTQIGGTVGGGSTVSGTINGGSDGTISGTINSGGDSNITGSVSSGGGGGSSGGTNQNNSGIGGSVLGQSDTGTNTPTLPNTGFGPSKDQASSAPLNSIAAVTGLGILAAFIGYEIVRRRPQRLLQ